jgi:hypothetical protein
MRAIAERNMLLRERVAVPLGLSLVREEFRDDWGFVPKVNADRLTRKIHPHGWRCLKVAGEVLRSGVGATSKEAVASALKLALRNIGEDSNAVEVAHIELTQYPWFFLARVSISPYVIEPGNPTPAADDTPLRLISGLPRRPMRKSTRQLPRFACAMPQLKQMLISSRTMVAKQL